MNEICIVDDEDGIVDMVRDYLSESYEVRTFTSPEAAIAEFEHSYRPDILVTDIKMPETDGFELVRSAREHIPSLPVVMMSGYAEKRHVIEAIEQEIGGFLEKPFSPDRLKTLISNGIRHSQRARVLEDLVLQYNILASALIELNKHYSRRFTDAENRVFTEGLPLNKTQPEEQKFHADIRAQNELERIIANSTRDIRVLVQDNKEELEGIFSEDESVLESKAAK